MSAKKLHFGIRYSDLEKAFLDTIPVGIQRVFNIGLQSLKLSVQSDPSPPCIYLSKSGQKPALPAGPLHQGPALAAQPGQQDPARCCPACPIKNAFGKRIPAAVLETTGQKENVMIDQEPGRCESRGLS